MHYYLVCFCPIFKLQNMMYKTQSSENCSRMLMDEGTRTVIQKSSGILTGVPFTHKTAVVGRCQVAYATWQCPTTACLTTFHVCKTRGCLCSFRLLMMGGVSPETYWASFKIRNNNILIHCCILLGFFTVRIVLWCMDPWTSNCMNCQHNIWSGFLFLKKPIKWQYVTITKVSKAANLMPKIYFIFCLLYTLRLYLQLLVGRMNRDIEYFTSPQSLNQCVCLYLLQSTKNSFM